jgi:hypothetical protein
MITWGLLTIFLYHPYLVARYFENEKYLILLYVFINTFLFPTLAVFLMKKSGFVSDIFLSRRKDRYFPMLAALIFVVVTAYQLYQSRLEGLPFSFLTGTAVCILLCIMINFRIRISFHAAGAAGLCALLAYSATVQGFGEMILLFTLSILVAGLTGASRLYLKAHSVREVYLGYLLGFSSVFISVALL